MSKKKIKHFWPYRWWVRQQVKKFSALGYPNVSSKDLWGYLCDFRWKYDCPSSYKARITDIKKMTPNDYFTYESLNATIYKVPKLDDIDLDGLM